MSTDIRDKAVADMHSEIARQDGLWGYPQLNTPEEWVTILLEEVGEYAMAVNTERSGKPSNVYEELIQIAAVAIQAAAYYKLEKTSE